jgi:hypothetical protein
MQSSIGVRTSWARHWKNNSANELSVREGQELCLPLATRFGGCRGTSTGRRRSDSPSRPQERHRASCLYHNLDLWGVADIIMSEYPRITYQTSERTFDRLFKGTELPLAARFGLC